ncbi:DUF5710 domain-containing protein [Anthocerotibacter panamensis]|uniref:DUF5710 domain-containing protein n=1 Tax=Anthocerotibacter panamensis TaxID=2857077 RepID=UPI001C4016ED|nr:DUF5710 domain-containing protein [Anthocerotibacter panamensis]
MVMYLEVPFEEKDDAKQMGAKWHITLKKWYVPEGIDPKPFARWFPPKLTIELVPQTCWYSNVRSNVSDKDWDKLRQMTYEKANNTCEVCGGKGTQWPVECHEIWDYDDKQHIQKLVGLIALCPPCHEVKHMGFANTQGRGDIARAHLAKVNDWSEYQTDDYVERCFMKWEHRSQFSWALDITWLEQHGVASVVKDRSVSKLSKNDPKPKPKLRSDS